jgi:hypothetical protein
MLWMSDFGLAVGLDELLDPPSVAHPISSNEKEQPETNLKNTDELGDFMETPGALAFFRTQNQTKTAGCDTVGSFEVAQAAGFDSEEATNGRFHKTALTRSVQFQVRRVVQPLRESCSSSDRIIRRGRQTYKACSLAASGEKVV